MSRVKLSDVCTIRYGKDHKSLKEGSIPVYGSGGIIRHVDTILYDKKSVLIPRKGTLSNLFYVEEPFWTIDTLFYSEIDETVVIPKYLYYKLKTLDLKSMNVGTAVPSLTTALLNEIKLEIPSLSVQKKVANILSSFDDKIENNNAIIANLEEQAQTIFKSWFVDFKPFLHNNFIHSEVGEIPENWEVNTLKQISEIIDNRGKTPPLTSEETEYPIIDVATLKTTNRLIDYSKATKYVDSATYGSWFRSGHPHYGDILLSTVGSIGHSKLYLKDLGTIAQNVVAFRFNKDLVFFMYQWFKYNYLTLTSYNIGSVQPSIKVTQINKIKLAIPPKTILKSFNRIIRPMNNLINQLDTQNQKLVLMRDTLLPKFMSGEILVGDAVAAE